MKIELTADEVNQLKILHKSQTIKRYADRIKIILLLNLGYGHEKISDILLLDEDTIGKWKSCFLSRAVKEDLSSWFKDNYIGYRGKLSCISISHLRGYLNHFNVGSIARIKSYLWQSESIKFSSSGIQKLFKRIDISYQVIKKMPGKADVEKEAVFIEKMTEIVSKCGKNETVMFMDSVHPQHNTVSTRLWAEKGKQRWIQSNTGREGININGIYNPFQQKFFTCQAVTINAEVTKKLLQKVIEENPEFDKIYIVFDNARYNKCKEIYAFLANQNKIQMLYLPPYSPNLNLIERVWKFMHQKVIHLKYYDTFAKFRKSITIFLIILINIKKN